MFGSYLIRYPLGGMLSYVLQYMIGLKRLGHRVVFVEKAVHPNGCFDPVAGTMGDDPSEGLRIARAAFERFGLDDGFCFVDVHGRYHGRERREIEAEFAGAAAFFDMGTHGAWLDEAARSGVRVLLDGEPGYNQILMTTGAGGPPLAYDVYVTNGLNLGTARSWAPSAGVDWYAFPHPFATSLVEPGPVPRSGALTTIMNWRAHREIVFGGERFGQKDVEFERFLPLPARVPVDIEVAVAGPDVPRRRLEQNGWRVADAHGVTASYDAYHLYIDASLGEFSVCKNVFVALRTGWFGDRSAAYLAHGRPVVLQDTGFSDHLPTGEGLFAVSDASEAAAAIDAILDDPERHGRAAREIACEHLDAGRVLRQLCDVVGI
jgi:hypothetical protein